MKLRERAGVHAHVEPDAQSPVSPQATIQDSLVDKPGLQASSTPTPNRVVFYCVISGYRWLT